MNKLKLVILSVMIGSVLLMQGCGSHKSFEESLKDDGISYDDFKVEPVDARSYLEQNATILNEVDSMKNESQLSEAEVMQFLEEKGFHEMEVITNYNGDGVFIDEKTISPDSKEIHPVYYTYYSDSEKRIWKIMVFSNTITASLLISENEIDTDIIVSEKSSILSYDSASKTYFEIIPNEDVMKIIQVDELNSEVIDSIVIGG